MGGAERADESGGEAQLRVPVEQTLGGEGRRLLKLAWPVVLGQLGLMSMGMVDVLVSGRAGEGVLAAVGAGRTWAWSLILLGMGALHGLDPLISQAWGAGDRAEGERTLGRGLLLGLLLSAPIAALHLFAGPGLRALGQPLDIIDEAHEYALIAGAAVPFVMIYTVLVRYHQGQGRTRLPMVAVVVGNVLNLVLDLSLVQGLEWGPLSVPAMGVRGVALATSSVQVAMVAVMAWLSRADLRAALAHGRRLLDAGPMRALVVLCVPLALQTALEAWAFNVAGLMVGTAGRTPLAAHVIVLSIASFTFMVPLGVGVAASTRVGNLIGAAHPWQRAGWLAVALGSGWMGLCGLGLFLFNVPVLSLFSSDAAVIAAGATMLPIAAAFQLFDGVQASAFGVLRGAGDTRWPSVANLLGYWAFGLPLGWLLATRGGMGAQGVWIGLAAGLAFVALSLLARLAWVARRGAVRLHVEP